MRKLAKTLAPDNITLREPLIFSDERDLIAVFQPAASTPVHEGNVCAGTLLTPAGEWWKVGGEVPDGSFALFRRDSKYVEVVTDMVASRSIWYVLTPDLFVASSSQRAVIACLRSFEPDENALAWMLSQGSIGFGNSWDSRVKPLPIHSQLRLDRDAWSLSLQHEPFRHAPEERPYKEAKTALASAIDSTMARLDGDMQRTILLLSGGKDSRFMMYGLLDRDVKTLTWGMSDELTRKHSDPWVAMKLVKRYNLNHEYRVIDQPVTESVETILNRYVSLSEASVDNFTGYLDGMRIYKQFYEEGVDSLIRGDYAGLGFHDYDNEFTIRQRYELWTLADYSNLAGAWMMSFASQKVPDEFLRQPGESFTKWCDRLQSTEKVPKQMTALNEIKTWFIELHNPLLTRSVVSEGLRLTDELRRDRALFRDILHDRCPDIGYARFVSPGARKGGILRTEPYVEVVRATLDSADAREIISDELVEFLLPRIETSHGGEHLARQRLRKQIVSLIPKRVRKLLRRASSPGENKPKMDYNVMAFRAFLAVRAHRMLREDAKLLA